MHYYLCFFLHLAHTIIKLQSVLTATKPAGRRACFPQSSSRCSFGLRSWLLAKNYITPMPEFSNKLMTFPAFWQGALSCWKIKCFTLSIERRSIHVMMQHSDMLFQLYCDFRNIQLAKPELRHVLLLKPELRHV